ncbi:MAG: radical SAM/SPASM domain-containing protein [Thermodesulfobacteriota bacterium]
MKAAVKPRIELENRTRLETVIPIPVPFLVFLDPCDLCNFQCKFCPTGNRELIRSIRRPSGLMDFDLYRKVVDDLAGFGAPVKVLRLYKDGEPLLHPRFADMVRYAKKSGCALQVDTTTNASLLNPERNLELIAAGLDRIHISLEGMSAEAYQEFSRYPLDFDRFVDNIRHLYEHRQQCLICIKVIGDDLAEEEKSRFFEVFGNIADRVFIEHVAPCWPGFQMQGVAPNPDCGIYGQAIREVTVCPYIFYSLSINTDGTVSLCFLDWSHELIIGDLATESLVDIWNGDRLYEYRRLHLQKRRAEHPICAACGQLSYCMPDDIDAHAADLLQRLETARAQAGRPR